MAVDILAIGAHMGDEVAWGMALAAHRRQGFSIGMLHLTPGEKGHRTLSAETYAVQKRAEAAECAAALGAEMWAFDYGDGELPVNDDIKFQIGDAIREAQPKLLITHWRGSMHKDHTAAADNLPDALFYAALPAFQRALPHHRVGRYLYAENWEDLRDYEPEVYLEILPDDIAAWEKAMQCYELFRGGVSSFPYLDYYRSLARTRGCEIGAEYACTFAVPPESRRRKLKSLLP
ncbi:MAG: PIG-L family deacetylase [Chloroflexi bacterium]|nr:PIG-L family deacetylase [Chloroflexota bacterium]